jgi:hypothetical protein
MQQDGFIHGCPARKEVEIRGKQCGLIQIGCPPVWWAVTVGVDSGFRFGLSLLQEAAWTGLEAVAVCKGGGMQGERWKENKKAREKERKNTPIGVD